MVRLPENLSVAEKKQIRDPKRYYLILYLKALEVLNIKKCCCLVQYDFRRRHGKIFHKKCTTTSSQGNTRRKRKVKTSEHDNTIASCHKTINGEECVKLYNENKKRNAVKVLHACQIVKHNGQKCKLPLAESGTVYKVNRLKLGKQ